ncbi:MAG TPA: hypothetical protein VD968_07330 [Pyrinomonadaceae bacterium]|nr:hypothetical protein [Pyrinomonadaceae bacterium]
MENVEGVRAMAGGESPAAGGETRARAGRLASILKGRWTVLAAGALMIGAAFWYLQFSTAAICCGDYDAYYHFRWSRMLLDSALAGQFPPSFNALPLTTLNPRDYVDHHFLFHVLQIPFTLFDDFQTGAKVGTWLFACLAVFACYWLLVRYRISYPLVWLVAILGSSAPFLYRIHMGKAMSVSIVLLIVGIHLLFRRKYRWLLPLAFVFALTYDMFALLVAASVFWAGVILWSERRLEWKPVALVAAGALLGFVINPYFPHNFQLLYQHLVIKVTPKDFTTAVGSEWYPYSTWEFLGNCGTAVVAMVAGYLAFRDAASRDRQRAFFLLLFSTLLLLVQMRWRRFAEYFPPFAILFAAFALEPLIAQVRARLARPVQENDAAATPSDVRASAEARMENARAWEFVLVGTALILLAAPAVWYARVTSQDIAGMGGPDRYRGGMEWISKNVPAGEPVFNSDWDDFPKLFFYDPQRPFIAGLDPTYLLDRDPELMRHYERIGRGEEENPGPIIREKFCVGEGEARRCARYVITDHEHEPFYNNALDSGWFDEVYADDDCAILRVRDEQGPPPPDNVPPGEDQPTEDGPDSGE